jgi:prominin 1
VWVIFLFSAALMVITLVHFLLGIVAERAICEPLQEPENNRFLTLVDKVIRLDKFFDFEEEVNVSSIIRFVKKFTLEQATRSQRGCGGVALLFL